MVLSGNVGPSNAFRETRNPARLVLLLAGVALLLAACSQPTPDAAATPVADTLSGIEADRQARVYESAHTQGPPPTPPVYADTYADCLQKSYDVDAEIDRLATAQNEGKVLVDGQVLEAVRAGSRASVENVLKELPGVNIPVFYGTDTPLHLAAERNPNPEVVALLLDRGADIHARNSTGCYMPLHLAVQHNPNPEVVALLLDRGADIHAQTLGLTTLHWAVGGVVNPKLEVVALLLDRGADVNAKDSDGAKHSDVGTPLHSAATGSDTEMVALLLDWGADVHAKNDESETPLHEAARDGNVEEAVLLLDHGADIHAEDVWGRTPLHEAARDGNVEVVALLLNRGADIRAEDVWGRTPCRMAQDWLGYFAGTLELERLCAL
jgi:hypothetical protein